MRARQNDAECVAPEGAMGGALHVRSERAASALIARFRRATPEDLARCALLKRTDTKFVIPLECLLGVLESLAGHYLALESGGQRQAQYQTLYFDTPELRCFNDHRRGRLPRYKVRIRHYADRRVSFLEIKGKLRGGRIDKFRQQRDYGESTLSSSELGFVERHTQLRAATLAPQLWTHFSRVTLIALASSERVTLDWGLRFVRGPREAKLARCVLMEVKQPRLTLRSVVMHALRTRGIRPKSVSKYCAGTILTEAPVRPNRFLETLRHVGPVSHLGN